jgi:hypothetical protein
MQVIYDKETFKVLAYVSKTQNVTALMTNFTNAECVTVEVDFPITKRNAGTHKVNLETLRLENI